MNGSQPPTALYDLKPEHLVRLARLLDRSTDESVAAPALELRAASERLAQGGEVAVVDLAALLHDVSQVLVESGDPVLALLCRLFFETLASQAGAS